MMINKMLKLNVLLILLSMAFQPTFAQTPQNHAADITMFPTAEAGFQQVVINMAPQKDENNFKIEFYAGKTVSVDCNQHWLSGTFNRIALTGWGYDYYTFSSTGDIASTRMACPGKPPVEKFVKTQSQQERYNSKLPIVLYIPTGYEVRYKVWKASNREIAAVQNITPSKVQNTNTITKVKTLFRKTANAVDTSIYPVAKEGMKQYYISTPTLKNEDNYQVGFYVGKMMDVDCNQVSLGGTYDDMDDQGAGYSNVQFTSMPSPTTLMACVNSKTARKFITTQPQMKRYNSKSTILVTVPSGYDVKYRIWRASNEYTAATLP